MALNTADKQIIAACPLLKGLNDAILQEIYTLGQLFSYEKDAAIDCLHSICIILSGRACIRREANNGHFVVLDYVGPSRALGPAQIFIEDAALSQPFALTAMRIFRITKTQTEALLKKHASFQKKYIQFLSERISFLTSKIVSLTGSSIEDRLLYYIQQNADDTGRLTVRSFTELAALLNIGRASLYRAIATLTETNVVSLIKHTFFIQ